ncbi:MAG: sensor histidine kinase [Oscillospiraceae bacterium]
MIRGYMRYRRTMLCAAFVAVLVFPTMMVLSRVEAVNVAYAAAIYLFVIAVFVVADAFRYFQKIKTLREISENISCTTHDYPKQENNIERLYSNIIFSLYGLMDDSRKKLIADHAEQVEYYTMWLHQIKTPISAMRLALESEAAPSSIYEQELFKIERYIEMALQYVRMRNLENDLVLMPYSVDELLRESVKKYSAQFIHKNLTVDFEPINLTVITDKKWFCFVAEQFLSNAVKYTKSGGVKIYKEGASCIVIEDSGIGIRSEDLPRVFEKGYTGYNGRIDMRASGLGLYMAGNIAKQLSIVLSAESKIGVGTRIKMRFNAAKEG